MVYMMNDPRRWKNKFISYTLTWLNRILDGHITLRKRSKTVNYYTWTPMIDRIVENVNVPFLSWCFIDAPLTLDDSNNQSWFTVSCLVRWSLSKIKFFTAIIAFDESLIYYQLTWADGFRFQRIELPLLRWLNLNYLKKSKLRKWIKKKTKKF